MPAARRTRDEITAEQDELCRRFEERDLPCSACGVTGCASCFQTGKRLTTRHGDWRRCRDAYTRRKQRLTEEGQAALAASRARKTAARRVAREDETTRRRERAADTARRRVARQDDATRRKERAADTARRRVARKKNAISPQATVTSALQDRDDNCDHEVYYEGHELTPMSICHSDDLD